MPRRRIILLFAFIGVAAALGMSWHVHTSADLGPQEPNCPAEFYSLFSLREDAPDDDAMKSDRSVPIEIQFRAVCSETLNTRYFTYADKEVPLVRGMMKEQGVFQFLEFMQGDRGCHIMQAPKVTPQSGVPFEHSWGLHRPVGTMTKFDGFTFKGNATVRKDGRIRLQFDATHSGPKVHCNYDGDSPIVFQTVNAKGSFVLESGQTCFFGGLKRRGISTITSPVPLLSELPWIGSWFIQSREVELDQELLFLATVRIAN